MPGNYLFNVVNNIDGIHYFVSIYFCWFFSPLQLENGVWKISPRKDRNATPLCHGEWAFSHV